MLRIITNLAVVVTVAVVAMAAYSSNWWIAGIAMATCALFLYVLRDRQTHVLDTPSTDTPLWRRFLASASSMRGPTYILLAAIAFVIALWFQIHFDVPREEQGWMFFLVWSPTFIVLLHVAALALALWRRP